MAYKTAIIQFPNDNAIASATVTSTVAPMTGYSLTTLKALTPEARVKFAATSVTITFTFAVATRIDLAHLPMSNCDAGSSVLTITNGSGLSQAVTIPAAGEGGWQDGAWIDLTTASPSTRTSTTLNYVFSGNTQNLILSGGCWAGAPIRELYIQRGGDVLPTYGSVITKNEYLTEYAVDYQTRRRGFRGQVIAADSTTRTLMNNWIDGGHGGAKPALFIRNAQENDAWLVRTSASPGVKHLAGLAQQFEISVTELSKGQPI